MAKTRELASWAIVGWVGFLGVLGHNYFESKENAQTVSLSKDELGRQISAPASIEARCVIGSSKEAYDGRFARADWIVSGEKGTAPTIGLEALIEVPQEPTHSQWISYLCFKK